MYKCMCCKFYDETVDYCNADEYCYQDGKAEAIEEMANDDWLKERDRLVWNDAIDEAITLGRTEIDFESQAEQKRFVEFMERLKNENK